MKKWKIIAIIIFIILFIIILMKFFLNNDYKNSETGNNKSIQEIEQDILNIKTYKATLTVTIKNNRNENNYKIMQEVTKDYEKQVTTEPKEIEGLEMTYKNGKIEIKNTELNLSKIYENYPNVAENNLFLTQFLQSYQNGEDKDIETTANEIIMKVKTNKNKYNVTQMLYVNMNDLKPKKLEILDNNNNIKVYILYNEIEINI